MFKQKQTNQMKVILKIIIAFWREVLQRFKNPVVIKNVINDVSVIVLINISIADCDNSSPYFYKVCLRTGVVVLLVFHSICDGQTDSLSSIMSRVFTRLSLSWTRICIHSRHWRGNQAGLWLQKVFFCGHAKFEMCFCHQVS